MNRLSRVGFQDGLGGILLTALGIIVLATSNQYVWLTSSGVVGPAMLPGACGALLIVFGIVQISQALLARRDARRAAVAAQPTVASGGEAEEAPTLVGAISTEDGAVSTTTPAGGSTRRAWLTWLGVAVSVLVIPYIGLIPAIGLLAVYLLKIVSQKSWLIAVVYAAGLAIGLYLVFVTALGIPLPMPNWIG